MENLIPIVAISMPFLMVVAIVCIPAWLKSKDRREMQATVRTAIQAGQPMPPELIAVLSKEGARAIPSRTRDIRTGIIWLAVGIGIAAFSFLENWSDMGGNFGHGFDGGLLGIAAIPTTIGLAYIALSFFNKNKD